MAFDQIKYIQTWGYWVGIGIGENRIFKITNEVPPYLNSDLTNTHGGIMLMIIGITMIVNGIMY